MIYRRIITTLVIALCTSVVSGQDGGDLSSKKRSKTKTVNVNESQIRAAVDGYLEAINRGDASAAADYWSETGQIVSADGSRLEGKTAIAQDLESSFAGDQRRHVSVADVSIRFLTPTVATEEGVARVISADGESSFSNYLAIHVKQKNQWKMESLRESEIAVPTTSHDHLKELEWMIGNWVDQDGETKIETTCQWTSNGSFLTRSFTVSTGGDTELEGTQVIGWDPKRKQLRSWVFDSDGGFGDGSWTRSGDQWTVKTKFMAPDGRQGQSTNSFTYVDANTFNWQSKNRSLGDERLDDVEEVTVNRVVR